MMSFYAFCRVIDDLADDKNLSLEKRKHALDHWRYGIENFFSKPNELQDEITQIIVDYKIPRKYFLDIIDGCRSDLDPQFFKTWEDLKKYCYRVAGCVGLISTRIFGCKHSNSHNYALRLGEALQLTNILRDVGEDIENAGRVYLPEEDLKYFNLSKKDIMDKIYDERFVRLMSFEAQRARELFIQAQEILPAQDKKNLQAAEAMREIYSKLLDTMELDEFQVFSKRYSLKGWQKASILLKAFFLAR